MKKIPISKKRVIFLGAIVLFLGLVISFFLFIFSSGKGEEQDFIVKSGQSTRQIATELREKGIIGSTFWFLVYAKLEDGSIQAGIYHLNPAKGIRGIYRELTATSSDYSIRIQEGWRVTQIDAFLADKGIIKVGQLTRIASADEGYLFPDTYRFLPNSDPSEIREALLGNFKNRTEGLDVKRESVIIASIVEREAKFDEDRPKIAAVYLNRIAKGMKLEADPTVQYAKGDWEAIKVSDYRSVNSPYNTYLYSGLPPGPICNPGLKSIEAVVHPDKNNYLYFFTDKSGHGVYSENLAEHEKKLNQAI